MKNDKVKIKNIRDKVILIDSLRINQQLIVGDNENKIFVILLCDEKDEMGKVTINIKGKNANVQILGIIIGSDNQKIDLYTIQEHKNTGSISDLLVKSVLFGKSRLQYRGLIKIEKGAQKSNAYQKNQNLLISKDAYVDSRPYLEILANDVRCTHGATVGKIDQGQLYYLMSRGIDEKSATKLIIEGFFHEVILRIPGKKIQNLLEDRIKNRINKINDMANLPKLSYS